MNITATPSRLEGLRVHTNLATYVRSMLSVYAQRRQLRTLDAQMLDDIGVSYKAARAEASRPIWAIPAASRR